MPEIITTEVDAQAEVRKKRWAMSGWLYGMQVEGVDRDKGMIRGCAVVTAGEAKGHDVMLDMDFVRGVVEQGNARRQGLKARFGHPTMSSTALGTFIGRFKNFRLEGNKALADLYLSQTARETPHGDLYEYVMQLAMHEPDMFGVSIVFEPGEVVVDDEDPTVRYATLGKLLAADVVDDPAANPDGLFSAFNESTLAGQVAEFLDTHPELVELVARHPETIDEFMCRYNEYRVRMGKEEAENMDDEHVDEVAADEAVDEATEAVQDAEAPADEVADDEQDDAQEDEALETETVADAETVELEQAEAIAIDDLQLMVDEFGAELTCEVLLNGGDADDARAIYFERLQAENAALREQLATREATIGDDPVEFTDDEPEGAELSEAEIASYEQKGLTRGMARLAAANARRRN